MRVCHCYLRFLKRFVMSSDSTKIFSVVIIFTRVIVGFFFTVFKPLTSLIFLFSILNSFSLSFNYTVSRCPSSWRLALSSCFEKGTAYRCVEIALENSF